MRWKTKIETASKIMPIKIHLELWIILIFDKPTLGLMLSYDPELDYRLNANRIIIEHLSHDNARQKLEVAYCIKIHLNIIVDCSSPV